LLVSEQPKDARCAHGVQIAERSTDRVPGGMHEDDASGYPVQRRITGSRRSAVRVSLIIPTLNEAANVGWVLERIPESVDEIVIVDGHSEDGTVETVLALRPDARIVRADRRGKGVALRAGFAAARGEFIVMIDADGSMDPAEVDALLLALEDRRAPSHPGEYEFVKGSRFTAGGGSSDISFVRRVGNGCLRGLVNVLYGADFTDLCYGLCAFRRDALDALNLQADGFEIETEIAVRALKAGLRIGEVPSFESDRLSGDSNLNTWSDGWRVFRTLMSERFTVDAPPDEPAQLPAAAGTEGHAPQVAA